MDRNAFGSVEIRFPAAIIPVKVQGNRTCGATFIAPRLVAPIYVARTSPGVAHVTKDANLISWEGHW